MPTVAKKMLDSGFLSLNNSESWSPNWTLKYLLSLWRGRGGGKKKEAGGRLSKWGQSRGWGKWVQGLGESFRGAERDTPLGEACAPHWAEGGWGSAPCYLCCTTSMCFLLPGGQGTWRAVSVPHIPCPRGRQQRCHMDELPRHRQ